MNLLPKVVWISFLGSAFLLPVSPKIAAQTAQIRRVGVVRSGGSTQIEIQTSKRVLPLTQVVTDPDRLVIDFADAIPGPELRTVTVDNGAVKAVRVGKVTANPPMTRIVVDLNSAQPFELFPSSKSVIVKVGNGSTKVAAAAPPKETKEPEAPTARPTPSPLAAPATPAASIQVVSMAAPVKEPEAPVERPAPAPMAGPATPAASIRVVPVATPVSITPTVSVTRWPVASSPVGQVKHVNVLKSGGATEIEIETSHRIEPVVQAIADPDRLVVDFPAALPGPQLHAVPVNQGEVKGVRVGLLSAKPPITRVVLDLKSAQVYQVFPSAKSVIVKLPGSMNLAAAPSRSVAAATPASPTTPPVPKRVDISYQDGKLQVATSKASLAEILNGIRMQTGADIVIPAGAEQEQVAVTLGPGSGREVMSKLLDGSRYNYIIVGTDDDPNKLERVVLSPKTPGGIVAESQPAVIDPVPMAQMQVPQPTAGAAPAPPVAEDVQPQGDSNPPPDTAPQPGDPQAAPN